MRFLIPIALAAMLAACGNQATDALAAAESADATALAGVIAYKTTSAAATPAGKAVLAKLQADQEQFDIAVAPMEAAASTGGSVATAAETEAMNAALAALQSDMTKNGVAAGAQ